MAKRYSGRAVVTVLYDDRRGDYKATVAIGKRNVWSGRIGEPKSRTIAVDSPKAYDDTAHAALSFADFDTDGEIRDEAAYDTDGAGWHVGRSVATKYPRHGNPSRRKAPKRTAAQRSASARKGARTRARNAKKRSR